MLGAPPTLHNPLFFLSQIASNHEEEFNAMVLLVVTINMIGMLLNAVHLQHQTNRSTLLTMFAGLCPTAGFETLSP